MNKRHLGSRPRRGEAARLTVLAVVVLASAPVWALEGPVDPLPGTYQMTWDGSQFVGLAEDGNMARSSQDNWWVVGHDGVHPQGTTGKTIYIGSVAIADNTPVYWGLADASSVAISLIPGPYLASEWMTFSASGSLLPLGFLRFAGATRIEFWTGSQWTTNQVPTRCTMTITHAADGRPVPLVSPMTLGLPAGHGGLLPVANTAGAYRIHVLFEAFDGTQWLPAYNYYNAPNTGGGTGGARYTFDSGFFYELPALQAVTIQQLPTGIMSITWSNLMQSVGYIVQSSTNILQSSWDTAYGFQAAAGVYTSLHNTAGDSRRCFRLQMVP